LIEGAIVPEIYTAMPFSIAFTALAWHALLSVPVGRPAALVIAALGAWATLTSFMPVPFAPVLLAALLGLALWCLWRLRPRRRGWAWRCPRRRRWPESPSAPA